MVPLAALPDGIAVVGRPTGAEHDVSGTPYGGPRAGRRFMGKRIVEEVLDRPGVHGARSSVGGSGGTVVVLCDRDALDDVDDLIR